MRILAAPDSYKGSLSATAVAQRMAEGVRRVFPEAEVDLLPVADGGEGTVEALLTATGGAARTAEVTGPMAASPMAETVSARWGVLGDGQTAVIEMAAAAGLPLVPPDKRNPLSATTYGVGQLIRAVLDAGLPHLIIGIGGSATNDGGAGCAAALGARFLDERGRELPFGGGALGRIASVDLSGLDARLSSLRVTVACDVDNPLCGPRGASAVFGPQKGARPENVRELDASLEAYARVVEAALGRQVRDMPGAGAAGGLGAGLMLFAGAKLRPGIDIVLQATDFEKRLQGADLVLVGEGNTDVQTAYGKAPAGIAAVARRQGVPVLCISGGLHGDLHPLYERGIGAVMPCPAAPMSLEDCMREAAVLVADATERACRCIQIGRRLKG